MPENRPANANAVAQSLSELTTGWAAAPGVDPATLDAARAALASSVLAVPPGVDLRAPHLGAPAAATAPSLETELLQIAQRAGQAAAEPDGAVPTTIAVVRSPSGASTTNPAGLPDWARGGQVIDSYGPFQDATGALHWVDLLPITVSAPVQFVGAAAPFAVVPVRREIRPPILRPPFPPPPPNELELGAGSVWFLASLLGTAFEAGAFTGFTITGGTLVGTQPFTFANGVYEAPAGSALTLTVSLAPTAQAATGAVTGPDAAAATATPPAEIVIEFTESGATLQVVANAQARAYGDSVTLHWAGEAPTPSAAGLPEVLIPCTAAPASFGFTDAASQVFAPSGSAPIIGAAWALPLAATAITALPEAAGPGVCELHLGSGAELVTEIDASTSVPIASWLLQIGTGTLFAEAVSAAQVPVQTTLTLWPEAAPATYPATIVFDTTATSAFGFLGSAVSELLIVTGDLTAHLDRPLDASGSRIPFATTGTQAAVILLHTQASTLAFVIGAQTAQGLPELSLILENALLRTGSPTVLIASGPISADQFGRCVVGLVFPLALIVPTLPDPYAASFTASQLAGDSGGTTAALAAVTTWNGTSAPVMSCALLAEGAAAQQPTLRLPATVTDAAPAPVAEVAVPASVEGSRLVSLALLDLSTKVDLFGVAIAPLVGEYATAGPERDIRASAPGAGAAAAAQAPAFALEGMSLALNGADIATFAVPQVSWEPMESTGPQGPLGPIPNPGSDGLPLLVAAPDSQQLVPFAPQPVLTNNIDNVAAGVPFAALFSLPFGLIAAISQPNGPVNPRVKSSFLADGGTFTSLSPGFQLTAAEQLSAAVSLTLTPPGQTGAGGPDPLFGGQTIVDGTYTATVMGSTPDGQSSVETIFTGEFSQGGAQQGVPLLRADLSGYGESIFSEWLNSDQQGSSIIKVQFEATRGRTAYEVIQAQSLIHPYKALAVRTITMQRQNAGWVNRSDSGWQPCSSGRFQYPGLVVHTGAILGVFNVRNIREQGAQVQYAGATYQPVLFDADIGIAPSLDVTAGARSAVPAFENTPVTLTPSQDLVGYLQLLPVDTALTPPQITALVEQAGPLTPAVSCTVEAGKFGSGTGTVLRCSAVEIDVVNPSEGGDAELGIALRGAPQIPRGGGWSMGVRRFTDQAPTALPNDFPVPLVQNNNDTSLWHIADAADLDSLQQPASYYGLLHATGTNKVLFEAPQIAVAASGAGAVPGLQFPQLTSARPGGVVNPGSPNLGDLAAILNSTGLFPELSAALSVLEAGELPQIGTIPSGFQYSKSYTFPPDATGNPSTTTILDLSVITITLAYGDTTQSPPTMAQLDYTVDSSVSPSWKLSLQTLSFQVTVPAFGPKPVLIITGGFYGDENTKPGLTNLNVTFGSALSAVQTVFSDLQALAAYLPGGVGADLDVAVSDGALTVSDTFNVADLPLGLGQLTDISLELGLQVTLSPLSVDFLVGLGAPDNPFNWIATPLAGNGLMNFGVQKQLPAFIIQAGIGLGLSIDLGIASGSASITIAVELDVTTNSIEVIATLTGQASVDVLDGLASASLTLSAGLGFSVAPLPVPVINPPTVEIPSVDLTLLATCSVGIHLSICWVVSVSWDGSWEFSQSFHTPALTVTA